MQKIQKSLIEKAFVKCFGESDIRKIKPYRKGNINTMFEVKLRNGKELMLRIFNEDWKARKEAFVYRDIKAHVDIPIPDLHCIDDSKEIIPNAYTIMSKVPGMQIDEAYRKYKNKRLYEQAGEILAKMHKIKFHHFGWILDNEIRPAFDTWKDFVWHDIELKLANIKNVKKMAELMPKIEKNLNHYSYLLNIHDTPSLLHKDYHSSHIIADKDKINGIIDVEWAIAGHTENDFLKMELWDFQKINNIRDAFFTGYLKNGFISNDYTERKKLYELWHWINMVNISLELKNSSWLKYNANALEKFLK